MADVRQLLWRAAALAALGAAACSGGSGGGTVQADAPPAVALGVQRVFPNLLFSSPVAMLQAPGDGSRWFIVEQGGQVRVFDNTATVTVKDTFVDIDGMNRVTSGGESGLLGMAFHPDFPTDRRVFLSYTATSGNLVSRISSFMTTNAGQTLDPASEKILLTLNQPEANHNGGNIAFGPDGLLYIGFGDGGGSNDQHGTTGNGQLLATMLGKMLRIDVGAEAATTYTIPPTNPFAANQKCGPATNAQNCPEIYAYGFRNPWRWSFDRQSGKLWVADVGQNALEEVDKVTLGGNYGWRCFEGTNNTGLGCGSPANPLPPVAQYGRSVGRSTTGGYVYRGMAIAPLVGRYVFGDFATGMIFNIAENTQPTLTLTGGFASGLGISSFGEDNDGEVYVVDYSGGGLYRISQ